MNIEAGKTCIIIVWMLGVLLVGGQCLAGTSDHDAQYKSFVQAKAVGNPKAFEAIRKEFSAIEGFDDYAKLIGLIDTLVVDIANHVDDIMSSGMGNLMDIDGFDTTAAPKPKEPEYGHARRLLERHLYDFSQGLNIANISMEQKKRLGQYIQQRCDLAVKYLASEYKFPSYLDEKLKKEATELFTVLPLLCMADENWSIETVKELPKSLILPDKYEYCEDMSLDNRCFQAALSFAEARQKKNFAPAERCEYFRKRSEDLVLRKRHRAAIRLLKSAISFANENKLDSSAYDLSFDLAKLYQQMGYPELSASCIKAEMDRFGNAEQWGKASMLYLKYLYRAGEFKTIIDETPALLKDKRCARWTCQITYILWVTHRNQGNSAQAASIQKDFITRYKDSSLCADMYFASAMEKIAEGEYAKASEILEIIEFRYPKTTVATKAKNLQERLKKTN